MTCRICLAAETACAHRNAGALLSRAPHCYRALQNREETMTGPEDDDGLAGKVALISGGGAAGDGIGNGRAAAILLARAGTRVLVVDRDGTLAERTVAMIAAEGGTAAAIAGDVTLDGGLRRL